MSSLKTNPSLFGREKELTMSDRKVLCHVVGWHITELQEIPVATCLQIQRKDRSKRCFGCTACSRLCVKCRSAKPVSWEFDLCKNCLDALLIMERFCNPSEFNQKTDYRICVRCVKRFVYYSVYGLCLHCCVTEFLNENPKPVNQEALEQEELVLPEEDLQDLSILTDAEQAIVELHQKEGFSFERIAQLFDLSASEIAKIYSAALELMQNS